MHLAHNRRGGGHTGGRLTPSHTQACMISTTVFLVARSDGLTRSPACRLSYQLLRRRSDQARINPHQPHSRTRTQPARPGANVARTEGGANRCTSTPRRPPQPGPPGAPAGPVPPTEPPKQGAPNLSYRCCLSPTEPPDRLTVGRYRVVLQHGSRSTVLSCTAVQPVHLWRVRTLLHHR